MQMANSLTKAKKKAWDAFSLYIRTRDAIRTTGSLDRCACVTCGREYPRTGVGCIQAGHFIASRVNSILFDERGCHGQCYGCNVGRNGAAVEYFVYMENTYGREVIDELRQLKFQTRKFTSGELELMAEKYTTLANELISNFTVG
jgi:hypothetical protein